MNEEMELPEPSYTTGSACINGAIRRSARRLGQMYDEAFAPCGLRATQYSLLNQIVRSEGPTMRALADHMVMDLSALGHTLKPLVRDGFLELVVDEKDRRSRRVILTASGTAKYLEARQIWTRIGEAFDNTFGAEQNAQLRATLDYVASEQFADVLRTQLSAG